MVSISRSICLGLFVAALGLGAASAAQQEQPVAGQQAQGQGVQSQAAADKGGAPPTPAAESGTGDAKGAESAAKAKRNYDEANLEVQRRIADYTAQSVKLTAQALSFTRWAIGLTAVESLLFVITTVFTVFAVIQAKRSADIAEKGLALTDRPQVLISEITIGDIEVHLAQPDPEGKPIPFGYKVHNYGKGVAWITGRTAIVKIGPADEALPPPDFKLEKLLWPLPPTHWFGQDQKASRGVNVDTQSLRNVLDGSERMFVFGRITYRDEEKRGFTHGFIYQYALEAKRFIPFDDDRYWVSESNDGQQNEKPGHLARLLGRLGALVPFAT